MFPSIEKNKIKTRRCDKRWLCGWRSLSSQCPVLYSNCMFWAQTTNTHTDTPSCQHVLIVSVSFHQWPVSFSETVSVTLRPPTSLWAVAKCENVSVRGCTKRWETPKHAALCTTESSYWWSTEGRLKLMGNLKCLLREGEHFYIAKSSGGAVTFSQEETVGRKGRQGGRDKDTKKVNQEDIWKRGGVKHKDIKPEEGKTWAATRWADFPLANDFKSNGINNWIFTASQELLMSPVHPLQLFFIF